MASTFNIGNVRLPAGSRDFGPAVVADTDSLVIVTIDRTVQNGLNSLSAATTLELTPFQSNDGGATWSELASAVTIGGNIVTRGTVSPQTVIGVNLWPGTNRQIKATVTVTGTAVTIQGTIATQ